MTGTFIHGQKSFTYELLINHVLNSIFVKRVVSMVHNWITDEKTLKVDICDILTSIVIDHAHCKVWDVFA